MTNLTRHLKYHAEKSIFPKPKSSGEKKHKCLNPGCEKIFRYQSELRSHEDNVHSEKLPPFFLQVFSLISSCSSKAVCLLEASPVIISEEKVMHQALTGSVENLFYLKEAEHSVNMVEVYMFI